MKTSPLPGKPAEPSMLVNVPKLVTAYFAEGPDPSVSEQRVAFGTSGHRGSAFQKAFNEWYILARCRTDAPQEPSALGHRFQSADGRVVARRLAKDALDFFDSPICGPNPLGESFASNSFCAGVAGGPSASPVPRTEDIYKIYAESFR